MSAERTPPPSALKVYRRFCPGLRPVVYDAECRSRPRVMWNGRIQRVSKIVFGITTYGKAYDPDPPRALLRVRRPTIDECLHCRHAGHTACRCSWLVGDAIVEHSVIDWLITHAGLVVDDYSLPSALSRPRGVGLYLGDLDRESFPPWP